MAAGCGAPVRCCFTTRCARVVRGRNRRAHPTGPPAPLPQPRAALMIQGICGPATGAPLDAGLIRSAAVSSEFERLMVGSILGRVPLGKPRLRGIQSAPAGLVPPPWAADSAP